MSKPNQEVFRQYLCAELAAEPVGAEAEQRLARAVVRAQLAIGAEEEVSGAGQAVRDAEAELERLRKLTADQGEELSAQGEALDTCARGYRELADALWGDEEGRPEFHDVSTLAPWRQLRDRHIAQMAKAVNLVQQAKLSSSGPETQRQVASLVEEVATKDAQLQEHERILDTFWEGLHPGQNVPDAEPKEIARQIADAWTETGRTQLIKEDETKEAIDQTADAFGELQAKYRGAVPAADLLEMATGWAANPGRNYRGEELVRGECAGDLHALLRRHGVDADAAGCSCGAAFTATTDAYAHECPLERS